MIGMGAMEGDEGIFDSKLDADVEEEEDVEDDAALDSDVNESSDDSEPVLDRGVSVGEVMSPKYCSVSLTASA